MDWPISMPFPVYVKKRFPNPTQIPMPPGRRLTEEETSQFDAQYGRIMAASNKCRTFILSRPLLERLMATDIKTIPTALIKLPSDVVYLDVSSLALEAGWSNHMIPTLRNTTVRGFIMEMHHAHKIFPITPGKEHYITVYIVESDGKDAGLIHECFGWDGDTWDFGHSAWEKGFKTDKPFGTDEAAERMIRLEFNSLLYINSANADLREEWLLKNTDHKAKQASGRHRRALLDARDEAGKVTRCGYYIYLPSFSEHEEGPTTGRKLECRFLVRGHWHHFWKGSDKLGTRELVLKWVQPFWKGPEMADRVLEKPYIVR